MVKPRTLRSHLTWIIAIIALIPIVLLGSIQVVQIYQISQEDARNQLDSMKRMADAVGTYVYYHRTVAETIAADISSAPEMDPKSITSLLRSTNGHFVGFTTLYVTDKEGRTLAFHSRSQNELIHSDFRDRDYFQQTAKTKRTTISPVFLSEAKPAKPLNLILFLISNHYNKYQKKDKKKIISLVSSVVKSKRMSTSYSNISV